MTEVLTKFRADYTAAFQRYLSSPDEVGLEAAYELGRRALNEELSALDIAEIHHEELVTALVRRSQINDVARDARAAAAFFTESLSTFEMTRRGYFEARHLYERERDVTTILQKSLLPEKLPEIPGVEVEAFYKPGGLGNKVGGDFYDVFSTGKDCWGVLIGDVCGKGPRAATLTSLARHTVRAGAMWEPEPKPVLELLNKAILRYGSDEFCTVVYAKLERLSAGAELTIACGGHPSPLVLHPNGTVDKIPSKGMLIGVIEGASPSTTKIELQPGDALVLYTDGVIEARTPAGFFGEARLIQTLESCAGYDAAKIIMCITDELGETDGERQDDARRDDIAILVLRALW
ncbi:MAG: PP2C family protein-serine/threonine phosphatase [Actinomycetota bacterium]